MRNKVIRQRYHSWPALVAALLLIFAGRAQAGADNPISVAFDVLNTTLSVLEGGRLAVFSPADQKMLDHLASDLIFTFDSKPLSAGRPLGAGHFSLGISDEQVRLGYPGDWLVAAGRDYQSAQVPRLDFAVGVSDRINVGGSYLDVRHADVQIYGLEASGLLSAEQGLLPALVLRGSLSRLAGWKYAFSSRRLDLIASKQYELFHPYAGVGMTWGTASVSIPGLENPRPVLKTLFAGVEMKTSWVNAAVEAGSTGQQSYVGVKISHAW